MALGSTAVALGLVARVAASTVAKLLNKVGVTLSWMSRATPTTVTATGLLPGAGTTVTVSPTEKSASLPTASVLAPGFGCRPLVRSVGCTSSWLSVPMMAASDSSPSLIRTVYVPWPTRAVSATPGTLCTAASTGGVMTLPCRERCPSTL